MCLKMRRFIVYHEEKKQGFGLLGSESRCSITSWKFVLLNDGKKRSRKRLDAIFKSVCKVSKWMIKFVIALGALAELALFFLNKYYN